MEEEFLQWLKEQVTDEAEFQDLLRYTIWSMSIIFSRPPNHLRIALKKAIFKHFDPKDAVTYSPGYVRHLLEEKTMEFIFLNLLEKWNREK